MGNVVNRDRAGRVILPSSPDLQGRLSRGWVISSAEFRRELQANLLARGARRERFELFGADRETHADVRCAMWEDSLRALALAFGNGAR